MFDKKNYHTFNDQEQQANPESETIWNDVPSSVKNLMATYLIKDNVLYPQPTSKQINQALNNRQNVDLPFIKRQEKNYDNDPLLCTKLPFGAAILCTEEASEGVEECKDGCMCITCIAAIAILSPFITLGLFADCARAAKRKYDNNQDEALYKYIAGPIPQIMK